METITAINVISEISGLGQRRRKRYRTRIDPFSLTDEDFRRKYRFTKESVHYIVSLVQHDLRTDRRGGGIPPVLQVLTALRCWGRREVQDDCGDLHGLEQSTVSRVCSRVACAIASLANTFIKMPRNFNEEQKNMSEFQALSNFPTVIGCIDCTHIKIRKTGGDQSQYYVNRKGFYSINVQVVCDAKLRILDIVARWRGCTHDSRIFSESNLKTRFDNGEFRGRLLGDSGYPLLPYLFTPILQPRNNKEGNYNRAHIRTRNTVERTFGVLKQRFQCLLFGFTVSLENAKTIIVALSVLHNIAIERNDEIIDDMLQMGQSLQPHGDSLVNQDSQGIQSRQAKFILNNFIQNNF